MKAERRNIVTDPPILIVLLIECHVKVHIPATQTRLKGMRTRFLVLAGRQQRVQEICSEELGKGTDHPEIA